MSNEEDLLGGVSYSPLQSLWTCQLAVELKVVGSLVVGLNRLSIFTFHHIPPIFVELRMHPKDMQKTDLFLQLFAFVVRYPRFFLFGSFGDCQNAPLDHCVLICVSLMNQSPAPTARYEAPNLKPLNNNNITTWHM